MMKKNYTYLMIALMAAISFAFVSCSDKDDTEGTGGTGGSNVVIPTGNGDVKFEPLSDAEVSALKAKGYNIVGTPVKVTQNGSEHVELNNMATVSIKIPDDFPKEQYGELVGVLISDKGSEYIFPDYAALQDGYVQFKTYHFSTAAAERNKQKLEQLFIEGYAVNSYIDDSRKERASELKSKLNEAVYDVLDDNDNNLLGDVLKQVIESNDIVKGTMEYVEAYEEGTLGETAVNEISQKLTEEMQTKALAILIGKLKKNPDNKKVMECLEKYMTKENVEKIASNLGEATSSYDMALTYAKDFAIGKMKDYAKSICPYVKLVEAEVFVIKKLIKFHNDQKIKELYKLFEKEYLTHGGNVDSGLWDTWKSQINNPESKWGMTFNEIYDLFMKRCKKQQAIDEKKEEMADMIRAWRKAGLLEDFNYYFNCCDYETRLSRLHILTERFRKEMRIKLEGTYSNERDEISEINDKLAAIVRKYIELYDKNKKDKNIKAFYEWAIKKGYLTKKLEEDVDALKTSGYEFVGGMITMDISFVNQVDWATGMGELNFEAGDNIVTMTPKGKGLHFELNYEYKEEKYTDVTHCEFDIDDVNLMLENKASLTNFSWTRKTNNWSGPFGYYFYGQWADTDFLLKQTQDMAFATSDKIKQKDWNEPWGLSIYYSANWFPGDAELHPSTCYFNRWTLGQYIDGEASFEQKGDHMEEGSCISLSLWFKYVEE